MHRHWRTAGPPVHVSAALYLGLNKTQAKPDVIETFDDLVNYVGAMPGGNTGPSPFPIM